MDNYGKLFLLLASIGLILLATSGKGLQFFALFKSGGQPALQPMRPPNPTDLRNPENSKLGETDLRGNVG